MTSPAAARDSEDGPRVYPVVVDGVAYELPSSSSVKDVLDKPAVTSWKLKTVARAIANDPLLQKAAKVDKNWSAVKAALKSDTRAADRGTEIHDLTERLDRGEITIDDVPQDLKGYCLGYLMCCERHGVEQVLIERTVYNVRFQYAGTFDRISRVGGYDGSFITDIKTGSGVWPEVALQLASYANAEGMWNPHTQKTEPLPADLRTDLGFVFHCRPDGCELIPVDLTKAWGAFRAVRRCWQWSDVESKTVIQPALPVPTISVDDL